MTSNRQRLVYGFYLLLAVGMTFPLITQMNSSFIGAPESDAYEYARHIWWYTFALQNGEPVFHHTYLAHPDGLPALWLWAIPLQSFPAVIFSWVLPLPVAYNLMVLLRLAFNGWAMFFLVNRLLNGTHTDEPLSPNPIPAAILSGAIYMLHPALQGQLFGSHAGIVTLWGAPLYIDALFRLRYSSKAQDYLLAGLFFVAMILGSNLMLVFAAVPITTYFVLARFLERDWLWLRRIVIGAVAGIVFAAVFFIPAGYEQATSDSAVDPGGAVRFSADVLSIVSPSFFHPLFSHLEYPRRVLGTNIVEGTGYIGIVSALLTVIGVWRIRAARGWLVFAIAMWIISLGPLLKFFDEPVTLTFDDRITYIPMPFALFNYLPVVDTIRTPARTNMMIGLAVALMAGYGFVVLARAFKQRTTVLYTVSFVLIVFIAFEYQLTWLGNLPHHPTVTAAIPQEIRSIQDDNETRTVLNLPYDNLLVAKEAMYLQTGHQKPIVAGFISRQTPVSPAKLNLLQNTLDPALLNQAEVDRVILFREWDESLNTHVYEQFGTPFYEDDRIAAFQVTDSEASLTFQYHVNMPDEIEQDGHIYFFAPQPLWVNVELSLIAAEERNITLFLNDTPIQHMIVVDESTMQVPLYMQAGYHTFSVQLNPVCPEKSPHPALACESVIVQGVQVGEPVSPSIDEPVQFERGITLESAYLSDDGEMWLWWYHAESTSDNMVRFVQLIDENDTQVMGNDTPSGKIPLGEHRTERLQLGLPDDLAVGTYRAYTGWYTLPDVTRLDVQTDVEGAVNDWVEIGTISVD